MLSPWSSPLPSPSTLRNNRRTMPSSVIFWLYTAAMLFVFINAQAVGSKDLYRCRQTCYQKFVRDWHHCMDFDNCKNMCITPPNINSYIPEAFSFLCWNNCNQELGPFSLSINSALRQGSLVLTDIAWDQAITNSSKQCLVTWEVSGGGLMGNLLTDSSTVELSLWLDTIYHVQVTCKHKDTGGMRRSYKLIVDTHKLTENVQGSDSQLKGIVLGNNMAPRGKTLELNYDQDSLQSTANDADAALLPVLKHANTPPSSKDFLSPYNPEKSKNQQQTTQNIEQASHRTNQLNHLGPAVRSHSRKANEKPQDSSTTTSGTTTTASNINKSKIFMPSKRLFPMLSESQSTVALAIIAAVLAFSALLLVCLLLRPKRKHIEAHCAGVSSTAPTNECRRGLVKSELLPCHTSPVTTATTATAASGISAPASTVSTASQTMLTTTSQLTLTPYTHIAH